jgi:hypothetical protein
MPHNQVYLPNVGSQQMSQPSGNLGTQFVVVIVTDISLTKALLAKIIQIELYAPAVLTRTSC